MRRHWIAVASAEHVMLGRDGGFMQVCHGKAGPLARIEPGDRIAYYSPAVTIRGKDRLQAFTAIGIVAPGAVREADMGGGFRPFRRDVAWLKGHAAPIAPLLPRLEFAAGRRNWGQRLRFGLLEVSANDFAVIAGAMAAALPP